MKLPTIPEIRKGLAAASAAVAEAVALGLLNGTAEKWVVGSIAVAAAAAVTLVPNDKPKGS